jgi:hypothetical protein
MGRGREVMKVLLGLLLATLLILHQDYWQWDDTRLVNGVLPWTLVYHLGLSLAAAFVWWIAVTFCWPRGREGDPS